MSVLNQSGEEQVECPLCMEPLEVDDLNFFPCTCGYQICRFCWHRIRTDENGLCPACRKAYSENPADFIPLSQEQVAKLKAEKRQRDQQRKAKLTESRKHLASVRVVQRNLVFVVGLPMRLADPEVLKRHEYFGKFGKIHKVVINQSTSYAGSQGPSASAYVTYMKSDDALRAIQSVNNITIDGRLIKSSLGTTKYCSHFMKNQPCPKADCMYLHDYGDPEASFTKEQMHAGKHQEYEKKLHENFMLRMNQQASSNSEGKTSAPIPTTNSKGGTPSSKSSSKENVALSSSVGSNSSSSAASSGGTNKENWPHLTNGGTGDKDKEGNNSKKERGGKKSKTKDGKKERKDAVLGKEGGGGPRQLNAGSGGGSGKGDSKDSKSTSSSISNSTSSVNVGGDGSSTSSLAVTPTTPPPTLATDSHRQPSPTPTPPSTLATTEQPHNHQPPTSTTTGSSLLKLPSSMLADDDNSSFFSANTFQKVTPPAEDESVNGTDDDDPTHIHRDSHAQHHIHTGPAHTHPESVLTDRLPDIETQEDWAAAFGFATSTSTVRGDNGSIVVGGLLSEDIGKRTSDLKSPLDTFRTNGFPDILSPPALENFGGSNGFYDITTAAKLNVLDMLMSTAQQQAKANGFGSNGGLPPFKLHQEMHQQHQPPNGAISNGLDHSMSKFFTDFHKNNKDAAQQYTNGFTGLHHSYYAGLQNNAAERVMLMQQKQLEEQLLNLSLKQGYGASTTTSLSQNAGINLHTTPPPPIPQQHYMNGENGAFSNLHSQLYGRGTIRNTTTKNAEDDLGFDPIQESQKAFAELMATEQTHKASQQHNSTGRSQINGVIHSKNGGHLPPPPGFIQPNTHMNSFGSKILPFLNMSNSQQINSSTTQSNWPNSFNSQIHQQQKNISNSCNDWKVLDPAILSSSRHYNPLQQAPNVPPTVPTTSLRDNFQNFANVATQQTQAGPQQRSPLDYANSTFSNFAQQLQPQTTFGGSFTHLNATQTAAMNWFGASAADLSTQISSPPGFRNNQPASKQQEC